MAASLTVPLESERFIQEAVRNYRGEASARMWGYKNLVEVCRMKLKWGHNRIASQIIV